MKTNIRPGILALILTAIGLSVSLLLFRDVHPLGGANVNIGRERALELAGTFADSLGIQRSGYIANADVRRGQDLIRLVYERYGIREGNALLRTRVHAFSWLVVWEKQSDMNFSMSSGGSSRDDAKDAATALAGKVRVGLDLSGGLTELEVSQPDSLRLLSLTPPEAHVAADSFLARYASGLSGIPDFHFVSEKRIELPHRTDFEFTWGGRDSLLDVPVTAKVRVGGNRIAGFSTTWETPQDFQQSGQVGYRQIIVIVLFVLLIVTMIVMTLKRIRSYEIGWRTGLTVGLVASVMLVVEMFYTFPFGLNLTFLAAVLFVPVFYGGALILAWSIAESVGREAWKDKFVTIDILTRGHVLDSRVARSVLLGIALGAASNAVWMLGAWGVGWTGKVWYSVDAGTMLKYLSALSPGVFLLAHVASMKLFTVSALVIFPMAILQRRISSVIMLVGISALIIPLAETPALHPWIPGHIVEAASLAVILWALMRFDVLTAYTGLVAVAVFNPLPALLFSGDHAVALSGNVVLGLIGVVMIVSWIGLLTKDRITDTESIVPVFARHISERERLRQELEIARNVQISLLPKTTPEVPGLEVSSRCVPALEVGGDYYDFVLPGDGRLGVVVGDVSGKGTEGAFYMTLTKGFLKAVMRASDSPSFVLTQANSLFYDNVERGNFISLIYGMIDPKSDSVTIARAGHNPAILCRSGTTTAVGIQPKGIALGLEPGDVFGRTIEEVTIPFRSGDVLVLYTDGFGESTNQKGEQFGDERLLATIARLAGGSADVILEGILKEVRTFVGKATQHDDMTIVVVKRTSSSYRDSILEEQS